MVNRYFKELNEIYIKYTGNTCIDSEVLNKCTVNYLKKGKYSMFSKVCTGKPYFSRDGLRDTH